MSSWFTLEFDSTPPSLLVDMPTRTIPQNVVEIEIKSNEPLATYQEIYIIDVIGNRRNYIFNKLDDYTYYGLIDFQTYPFGIATLYCRLKDEVFNESELYSKNINIGFIPNKVECFICFSERDSEIEVTERSSEISVIERKTSLDCIERQTNIKVIEREAKLEVV